MLSIDQLIQFGERKSYLCLFFSQMIEKEDFADVYKKILQTFQIEPSAFYNSSLEKFTNFLSFLDVEESKNYVESIKLVKDNLEHNLYEQGDDYLDDNLEFEIMNDEKLNYQPDFLIQEQCGISLFGRKNTKIFFDDCRDYMNNIALLSSHKAINSRDEDYIYPIRLEVGQVYDERVHELLTETLNRLPNLVIDLSHVNKVYCDKKIQCNQAIFNKRTIDLMCIHSLVSMQYTDIIDKDTFERHFGGYSFKARAASLYFSHGVTKVISKIKLPNLKVLQSNFTDFQQPIEIPHYIYSGTSNVVCDFRRLETVKLTIMSDVSVKLPHNVKTLISNSKIEYLNDRYPELIVYKIAKSVMFTVTIKQQEKNPVTELNDMFNDLIIEETEEQVSHHGKKIISHKINEQNFGLSNSKKIITFEDGRHVCKNDSIITTDCPFSVVCICNRRRPRLDRQDNLIDN